MHLAAHTLISLYRICARLNGTIRTTLVCYMHFHTTLFSQRLTTNDTQFLTDDYGPKASTELPIMLIVDFFLAESVLGPIHTAREMIGGRDIEVCVGRPHKI